MRCWSFSVIETSYVIYVLEPIYCINCHATVLCDGCLVLFYDYEVCLVGGIIGVPMVIDFAHCSSDGDSIDGVPHAKLFISACLNSLRYLRFSTCWINLDTRYIVSWVSLMIGAPDGYDKLIK
jgi:hypothetical protein